MADIYEFKCTSCDYRAEVSGGRSRGFEWESKTVLCRNCKELGTESKPLEAPRSDEQVPSENEVVSEFKALFQELDSDDDEFTEDAESLFGYHLDLSKCHRQNHTLVDWPIKGHYECPKCSEQMVRGECVMNID